MRAIVYILSEDTSLTSQVANSITSIEMLPIAVESIAELFAFDDLDSEIVFNDCRRMSFEDAIRDTRSILRRYPRGQIVLGVCGWAPHQVVAAVRAGASNVIEIPISGDSLQAAVREATLQIQNLRAIDTSGLPDAVAARLSAEEARILSLLLSGKTAKQIGADMDLSIRTIHYRKKSILQKLGAENRMEAIDMIRRAVNLDGLVPSQPSSPANNASHSASPMFA